MTTSLTRQIVGLAFLGGMLLGGCTSEAEQLRGPVGQAVGKPVVSVQADPPKPFVFDGCSAPTLLKATYDLPAFQPACRTHDLVYWRGGSALQRAKADGQFYLDLLDAGASLDLAWQMFNAVHYFGDTSLAGAARWGFGWRP